MLPEGSNNGEKAVRATLNVITIRFIDFFLIGKTGKNNRFSSRNTVSLLSPAGRFRHVLVPQRLGFVHAVHGSCVNPCPVLEAFDGVLETLSMGHIAEVHFWEHLLESLG